MMVPTIVLIAGCLPHSTPGLPADLLSAFGGMPGPATFTVQTPPIGETGQDVAARLRASNTGLPFSGRAVPVYGVVDCHDASECVPGPGGAPGGPARTVWVVLYPDCLDPDGNFGAWTIVDAEGVGSLTINKCL